jgi:drug/metabolite transporter (DMT)-like permease
MPLRHDIRRGVAFMLAACALFTAMNVVIKWLGDRIPFAEQMFFRSLFALPVVLLVVLRSAPRGGMVSVLQTKRPGGHLLRAITGTLAMGSSFYALTVLPLAEHTALTGSTPLFVTLLSIPLLGEKVGIHRSSAVVAGFLGILVIAIGQGAFSGNLVGAAKWGLAAATLHGIFSALTTMLVRSLSGTEASTTIVLWQSLLMTCIIGSAMPFVWVTPSASDLLLLVTIGVVGGVAQVLLTEAWASAQVSALAPFTYSSLLWAILFGWIGFGDVPGLSTVAGALLIVLASLYIMHRELVRGRRKT